MLTITIKSALNVLFSYYDMDPLFSEYTTPNRGVDLNQILLYDSNGDGNTIQKGACL